MRRTRLFAVVAALAILTAGCTPEPDYLEMEPKGHVFKRPGEDLWWKAVAKKRDGRTLHKVQVSWRSSDDRVVTVDEVGRVKAVGAGRATVYAVAGKVEAEANVEVVAVGKLVVEPTELKLEARGEPVPLTITVYDQEGRLLKDRMPFARCEDEDVCRTSERGVHPVDPGQTRVVVTAEGQKAEVAVTVEAAGRKP